MKDFCWLFVAVFLAGTALPVGAQLTANGTPDTGSSNNGNASNGNSNNGAGGNNLPGNNGGSPKQSTNMNVGEIKSQIQAPMNGGNIASENTGQSGGQLPQMKPAPASAASEPAQGGNSLGSTMPKTGVVNIGTGKGKSKGHKSAANGIKTNKSLPSMKQAGASSASVTAPAKPLIGTTLRPVGVVPGSNNPPPPR